MVSWWHLRFPTLAPERSHKDGGTQSFAAGESRKNAEILKG